MARPKPLKEKARKTPLAKKPAVAKMQSSAKESAPTTTIMVVTDAPTSMTASHQSVQATNVTPGTHALLNTTASERSERATSTTSATSTPLDTGALLDMTASGQQVFRLAIDYGTTKIAAAWQISNEDSTPITPPLDVRFANGELKAPNIAAYDDGQYIWGKDLAQRLEGGEILESQVIRFAKLAIFPDPNTASFKERVERKLEKVNKTIHDLIEDGIRAVINYAKKHADETIEGAVFSVTDMPLELFLSVPQMWNPPANRIMTEAAWRAGAPHCELVYEPECAAIHAIVEQMQPGLASIADRYPKRGEVILIADIGGGTADFVAYEIMSDITDKARVKLQTVVAPEGRLCGSQWVNQEFLKWLEEKKYSQTQLRAVLKKLGWEKDDFMAQASEAFEVEKTRFCNRKKDYDIHINSHGHKGDGREFIEWTLVPMRQFFHKIIDKIMDAIDDLLSRCSRVKAIQLPGGFGHCDYLLELLRTKYKELKILQPAGSNFPNPVPRGALLRHKTTVRNVGSQFAWATLVNEPWNVEHHPDTMIQAGDRTSEPSSKKIKTKKGKAVASAPSGLEPDFALIFSDPVSDEWVVEDRWNTLLEKGTQMQTPFQTKLQVKEFNPRVPKVPGPFQMNVEVYWSPNDKKEHSPGRKTFLNDTERMKAGAKDNLGEDVFHWETVPITVPWDVAQNWKRVEEWDGTESFSIIVKYALQFNGPNVEFLCDYRSDPASLKFDDEGNFIQDEENGMDWVPELKQVIWRTSHNPIPQAISGEVDL